MTEFKLDPWQQKVMETERDITMRCGRQVGKSTVVALKATDFVRKYDNTVVLVMAASQRQSSFLFEKIKGEFDRENDKSLTTAVRNFKKKYKRIMTPVELKKHQERTSLYSELPTQTRIVLKNGSKLYSLPAGRTGTFIRGLTIDLLIADEAAYIPEIVWNSVLPMIAVSKKERGLGRIILLSTPFGKGGYFYNTFADPDFTQFHVSSENCIRIPSNFLEKEKRRMTKMEYTQEYLAEFVDEWNQFFPTKLIRERMTFIEWNTKTDLRKDTSYFIGVDIARYGKDETAFVISEMDRKLNIKIVKVLTTENMSLTDTVGRILVLDEKFRFNRIFIDDGGVGGGVLDMLLEKVGRRVVGINNARRSVDKEDRKRAILKEDLYSNALMLMEAQKLEMIHNPDLMRSLKSVSFEYTTEKNLKLYGDYDHIAEAFVRAAWCIREKRLKLFLA